jgi:hypothetical protein
MIQARGSTTKEQSIAALLGEAQWFKSRDLARKEKKGVIEMGSLDH